MKSFTPAAVALCSFAAALPVLAAQPPAQPRYQRVNLSSVYDHPLLQKKVSLSLTDADINRAVQSLAKAAGISLVVERPPTLSTRPVTLELTEAKLGDVLDVIGRSYGYRWRRKGEVFLLNLAPTERDLEQESKAAFEDIYNNVLTPAQREQVDRQGFIEGAELTPGQKGIIAGYAQSFFSSIQFRALDIGRVNMRRDGEQGEFSISLGEGTGAKK